MMSETPRPTDDLSPERRVRIRHEHTCGQMIWVVAMPDGPLYYAELLPIMPPPITQCPRCGEPLTPETLSRYRGGRR
jgi:hypothetical protein